MEKTKSVFKGEFLPYIIKWGRGLNLFGVLLSFGPCIALAIMGIFPPIAPLLAGLAVQLPSVMSAYFYEPISFFAVLGIPGSYMSFLSGNISNMRVPCSAVAQSAAGVEEGSDEGTIIATIGIAVSIIVNLVILTVGVVLGAFILKILPPEVQAALNLLLPALFASLLANGIVNNPKLAMISIPFTGVLAGLKKFSLLGFMPNIAIMPFVMLSCVFGTMAIGIWMVDREEKKANTAK